MAENLLAQALRGAEPVGGQMNRRAPMNNEPWTLARGLRSANLGTIGVPVVNDVLGAADDIYTYATDPSSRTWTNYGLSAAGLLPFVPAMAGMVGGSKNYPLADYDDWWGDRTYQDAGGVMTEMTPDEFLSQARPIDSTDELTQENVQDLIQHIQSGGTLDPLTLNPQGLEDGRHRALAAKELGMESVPVINYRIDDIPSDDEIDEILSAGMSIDPERNLQFLHNTSAEKLASFNEMGGLPMPSLAITKSDIPFEGFGDITLIGRPESFDPKASRLNDVYSADAYTVRGPRPVRASRGGARKEFESNYLPYSDAGYLDETAMNIGQLERKGNVSQHEYEQVYNWFERDNSALAKFADDNNLPMPLKEDGSIDYRSLYRLREENRGLFDAWRNNEMDMYFEPEKYFISNPDRDYYSQRASLKPYTAEEVTKFMKKSAGRGGEGGMATSSVGGIRSATTEKLNSLKQIRDNKDKLVTPEEMAIFKEETNNLFFDLAEAAKPYYEYDANGFRFMDEFSDFLQMSEKMGMDRAAKEVGFDLPDEFAQELKEYMDLLRSGQTEYFEAKPRRVVDLSEFGGAIVPENTPQDIMSLLENAKIQIQVAKTPEEALAARNNFQNLMFSMGGMAVPGMLTAQMLRNPTQEEEQM